MKSSLGIFRRDTKFNHDKDLRRINEELSIKWTVTNSFKENDKAVYSPFGPICKNAYHIVKVTIKLFLVLNIQKIEMNLRYYSPIAQAILCANSRRFTLHTTFKNDMFGQVLKNRLL